MQTLQQTNRLAWVTTLTVILIRLGVWLGPHVGFTAEAYAGSLRWHHVYGHSGTAR